MHCYVEAFVALPWQRHNTVKKNVFNKMSLMFVSLKTIDNITSIVKQTADFFALVMVPVDGATRPQGWAHLPQGQTLDSHLVEESGRYLLKSIFKKKEGRKRREDRESRSNETKRIWTK